MEGSNIIQTGRQQMLSGYNDFIVDNITNELGVKAEPIIEIFNSTTEPINEVAETKEFSAVYNFVNQKNTCTDGCDDGKLNIFEKIFHFGKGIVKTVVNSIHDIVKNPKKLCNAGLSALAFIGASCIPVVGPFIAAGMGIYEGGKLIISGFKKGAEAKEALKQAKTDVDAKDAIEDMGASKVEIAAGGLAIYAGCRGFSKSGAKSKDITKVLSEKDYIKDVVTREKVIDGFKNTTGKSTRYAKKELNNNSLFKVTIPPVPLRMRNTRFS